MKHRVSDDELLRRRIGWGYPSKTVPTWTEKLCLDLEEARGEIQRLNTPIPTVPTASAGQVERLAADMWHVFRLAQDSTIDWPTWSQLLAEGHQGAARVGQFRSFAKAALSGRDDLVAPAGDMAGEDDAAFVERMANKLLPDWGIDGKAAIIALAREGARREPVAGDGWQPIETAPKDGTRFDAWLVPPADSLLYRHAFRAPDARFRSELGDTFLEDRNHNIIDWQEPGKQYASHWRPLPAAPGVDTNATTPALCRTLPSAASPDVAGSGSEPVAWLWQHENGYWGSCALYREQAEYMALANLQENAPIRPLYAAPPASVDTVAVVTEEMLDAACEAAASRFREGSRYADRVWWRVEMRYALEAALRARQQAPEVRS